MSLTNYPLFKILEWNIQYKYTVSREEIFYNLKKHKKSSFDTLNLATRGWIRTWRISDGWQHSAEYVNHTHRIITHKITAQRMKTAKDLGKLLKIKCMDKVFVVHAIYFIDRSMQTLIAVVLVRRSASSCMPRMFVAQTRGGVVFYVTVGSQSICTAEFPTTTVYGTPMLKFIQHYFAHILSQEITLHTH